MEKKLFVRDLKVKDEIESIFFVKYIALMEARDGRNYLNVVLSDASGDIESRKWHGAEEVISKIEKGDYIKVCGKVNLYQNRLQLIVQDIMKIDSSEVNEKDFVPRSVGEPDKMFNELINHVEVLDDVYIKDLLKAVLFDTEIQRRIKKWSAAKSIHHAYSGGLLEHILSCTTLASILSKHYKLNNNYVVAGALLHDVAKIYELSDGPMFEYTEEGKLIGHVVKALELIDRFSSKINNFPHMMKVHLKHIILSHHGEHNFGSPKVPMTCEAALVHYIDLIDSKMNTIFNIKKSDNTPGNWSSYIKHMDRTIFKEELPHYTEYLSKENETEAKKRPQKRNSDPNLTHNLADKLKGFKIDE